jgi:16S rRNA (uracil1498-N3)-methyltransferase
MEHALPRFYHAHLESDSLVLEGQEAQHAIKVLRMQNGEQLELFNGSGMVAVTTIISQNKRSCQLQVESRSLEPKTQSYQVHMVVAPVKSMDRFAWLLEKATEIGVSSITPIITANSERRQLSPEKVEAIVLAAMKQSRQTWMPVLHPVISHQQWMKSLPVSKKLIAHCRQSERTLLAHNYLPGEDVYLLIGPEGDFTEPEVNMAVHLGCIPVSLGAQRLRTETAALQALMHIHFLNSSK